MDVDELIPRYYFACILDDAKLGNINLAKHFHYYNSLVKIDIKVGDVYIFYIKK